MTIKAQAPSSELQRLYRTAGKHRAVSSFLLENYRVLTDLGYDAMAHVSENYDEIPYVSFSTSADSVLIYIHGPNQKDTLRTVHRAIGGKWGKVKSDYRFAIKRIFMAEKPPSDRDISITIEVSNRDEFECFCENLLD